MTLSLHGTHCVPCDEESQSDSSYTASFATPPAKFHAAGDGRSADTELARGRQAETEVTADIHQSGRIKVASTLPTEAAASACTAVRRNETAPVAPKMDDHAGVAEALHSLQRKLSLLSHERALAERDLNALSDELSHGRSRRSRQRAAWLQPDCRQDDTNIRRPSFLPDDEDDAYKDVDDRQSSVSPSRPPAASSRRPLQPRATGSGGGRRTQLSDANNGSTALAALAPQQFPKSAAVDLIEVDGGRERDRPSRATRNHIDVYLAAAVEQQPEEEETAPSANVNEAHADLSAAEARCHRLDARLALMRRALQTATSVEQHGPTSGGSGEHRCACGRADCGSTAGGDRCNRVPATSRRVPSSLPKSSTAGAAATATKITTRNSQRPSAVASRSVRKGSASVPQAAGAAAAAFTEYADVAATKSSSAAPTLREVRCRRGPTAPTLTSAASGILRRSSEAASSSSGCSRLSSHSKVVSGEHTRVPNSGLALRSVAVRSGGPAIRTAWPHHQEHSDQDAAAPVEPYEAVCCSGRWLADGFDNPASTLRRLREEFTHLNREHRQLTLLVGDAIAVGRPSVDLERELDHLVERMDVKGDEIAQCVRTLTDVCQPPRIGVLCASGAACQAAGRNKWPAEELATSASAATVARSAAASSSRRRRARPVAGAKSKASRSGRSDVSASGSGSRRRRSIKAVGTKAKVVVLCRSRKPSGGGGCPAAALQLRRFKLEQRSDSDRVQNRVSWA